MAQRVVLRHEIEDLRAEVRALLRGFLEVDVALPMRPRQTACCFAWAEIKIIYDSA